MAKNKVVITKTDTSVVSAGIQGPRGDQGPKGDTGIASMGEIPDVELTSLNNDDTLQYDSSSQKWTNRPPEEIVDGGNF